MRTSLRSLVPVDVLTIGFVLVTSVISVFMTGWNLLVPINIALTAFILALAAFAEAPGMGAIRFIHRWYIVPTIFLMFKESYMLIQATDRLDWDHVFIAADRALFGVDPTVWLMRITTPLLTEILQIAYAGYYFIMLAVGVELFLRREQEKFSYAVFVIAYGFYLSYLGYLAFPAVGPRFTLHDFATLDAELPGLWLSEAIRAAINAGESIPTGVADALRYAQRDAFPSGHTEMALLSMYLAHKFRLRSRHVIDVVGTLLVISTVYLRYHYVVDLVGGACCMLLVVWSAPPFFRRWNLFAGRPTTI
jgi:membrane-associated phospholipid phosphatase